MLDVAPGGLLRVNRGTDTKRLNDLTCMLNDPDLNSNSVDHFKFFVGCIVRL